MWGGAKSKKGRKVPTYVTISSHWVLLVRIVFSGPTTEKKKIVCVSLTEDDWRQLKRNLEQLF